MASFFPFLCFRLAGQSQNTNCKYKYCNSVTGQHSALAQLSMDGCQTYLCARPTKRPIFASRRSRRRAGLIGCYSRKDRAKQGLPFWPLFGTHLADLTQLWAFGRGFFGCCCPWCTGLVQSTDQSAAATEQKAGKK